MANFFGIMCGMNIPRACCFQFCVLSHCIRLRLVLCKIKLVYVTHTFDVRNVFQLWWNKVDSSSSQRKNEAHSPNCVWTTYHWSNCLHMVLNCTAFMQQFSHRS